MSTKPVGALAGPETAAEHVRNAMMMLDHASLDLWPIPHQPDGCQVCALGESLVAVRARLARALAALEGSGS